MEISSYPLVGNSDVLKALRPEPGGRTPAALRTIRAHGRLSPGIEVKPRSSQGLVQGSLRLYCSLAVDAARLARRHHDSAASTLAHRAARLESSPLFVRLAKALGRAATEYLASLPMSDEDELRPSSWLRHAYQVAISDETFTQDVIAAVDKIQVARRQYTSLLEEIATGLTGTVVRVGQSVVIVDTNEGSVPLRRSELGELDLDYVGAAVGIDWEDWEDGSAYVAASPAIDLRPVHRVERSQFAVSEGSDFPNEDVFGRIADTLFDESATIVPLIGLTIEEPEAADSSV